MNRREMELTVRGLETRMRKVEVMLGKICKELELAKEIGDSWTIDPFSYAHDDLDRRIIQTLLTNKVLTATQIAETLKENRHTIGKRLKRMEKESERTGEKWLHFNPSEKDGHYRAWWLIEDMIKRS